MITGKEYAYISMTQADGLQRDCLNEKEPTTKYNEAERRYRLICIKESY